MNMTRFTKCAGIGNDFVMIDDMAESCRMKHCPKSAAASATANSALAATASS